MRALKYFFDEALASLRRGLKTAAIATATIAVAFIVLGAFLILTSNLERLFARWQNAAEFSVYLADTVTADERSAVEKALRESAVVGAAEPVSKEEALRRFRQNFPTLADAAGDLPANPLPASFTVPNPVITIAMISGYRSMAASTRAPARLRTTKNVIQRTTSATIAPIPPWISPSTTNGPRMYAIGAPTSCMM